jgi:hypothetical protein
VRRTIEITIPLEGDAEVFLPYADGNTMWIRAAAGGRKRPIYDRATQRWTVTKTAARRIFDTATDDGRSARLTRTFRPDTEQCTGRCQGANPYTRSDCTCICGGEHHGQSSDDWTAVGDDLRVRRGAGGLVTQTTSNGIR